MKRKVVTFSQLAVLVFPLIALFPSPLAAAVCGERQILYAQEAGQASGDFEVPQGEVWSVDAVRAASAAPLPLQPPAGFRVAFHLDAGGVPGEEVCSYPNVLPTAAQDAAPGDLLLPLPSGCTLCASRRYHLSLQALGGEPDVTAFTLEGRKQLPRFVKGDFNGDLCADLVFQSQSTGEIMIWFMNGTVRVGPPQVLAQLPDPGWTVAGTHDFNRDGKNDLVLQDAQEHVVLWMMNGVQRLGVAPGLNTPSNPDRRIVATAGSASSPDPDLVCHGSKGKVVIWDMIWNPEQQTWMRQGGAFVGPVPAVGMQVDAALDFNGDQRLDLLLTDATSSEVSIWLLDDLLELQDTLKTSPRAPSASGWRVAAVADYGAGPDGSEVPAPACGTLDLVWQNRSSYRTVVWHLNGNQERTDGLFTTPDGPGADWLLVGPR